MRIFSCLAVFAVLALGAAPSRAQGPVCGMPVVPPELPMPGYSPTAGTQSCGRQINAAYAQIEQEGKAFIQAQRRIYADTSKIQSLLNGTSCESTSKAYLKLRTLQYAAMVTALNAELQEAIASCSGAARPVAPTPTTGGGETPAPPEEETPAPPQAE